MKRDGEGQSPFDLGEPDVESPQLHLQLMSTVANNEKADVMLILTELKAIPSNNR